MESTTTEIILKNIERELKEFKSNYVARNLEIDARFEKIDAKFENIDNKFEKIDNKFDQMNNKIDSKFDQMNGKIDKLTERIHRNEMKVYGVSLILALAASVAIRYFLA